MLVWLSVVSKMQTCIWPSWCHCHSLALASVKSRLVLPFWYRLTRVVPEKGPLNMCMCVCSNTKRLSCRFMSRSMCCKLERALSATKLVTVELSWVAGSGMRFQMEELNNLTVQCKICHVQSLSQRQLELLSHFDTIPACDGQAGIQHILNNAHALYIFSTVEIK